MPLSEFLRLAIEKLESSKQKSCSTDLPSRTENDSAELAWKNGQITVQGQFDRITRSPTHHRVSALGDPTTGRIEKSGGVESILDDISPVVPSGRLDLSQNDGMVPQLSYPVDDCLQDYCSEPLPEISSVTAKGMLARNSSVSGESGSSCDQAVSNLDSGENAFKCSFSKVHPLCLWPPRRGQTSDTSLSSGVPSIISNTTSNHQDATFGNCAQGTDVVSDSSSMKMESQNIALPGNNSSWLNFSHFSKPVTLVKANLPNSGGISSSVSSGVETMEVKEKVSASRGSNPAKSMPIERLNSTQKDMDFYVASAPTVDNSRQLLIKEPKESLLNERIENFCQETSMKTDKSLIESNITSSTKVLDGDRTDEPMVASSSIDSRNSADRVSYEQKDKPKRKFCDIEESECHSSDTQTGSVGVKKQSPAQAGIGSKRSRATEVHNLSEKRRRERINEKMRVLQELIPNCNKADKASMLDDAIEYLKNLQLQVQIMSMRAGLCMPPVMFPPGTRHMYPASIPHFSPMGVGMGMSMRFGNINCGSPQFPVFPVPSLQGAHFPSSALGLTNLLGMPWPNLPVHVHPPPQLHIRVPTAPSIPSTGQYQTSAMNSSTLRVSSHSEVPSIYSDLNSGDPATNKKSQSMHNAEASSSINSTSNQVNHALLDNPTFILEEEMHHFFLLCTLQATSEVSNKSAVIQENNQPVDALTSTTTTEITKEGSN